MMSPVKIIAFFALVSTALIWGFAFSGQRSAMRHLPPLLFTGARAFIGFLSIAIVVLIINFFSKNKKTVFYSDPSHLKSLFCGGFLCGSFLAAATLIQQYGLVYTSAGKAAFLTTVYIALVPWLSFFIRRKATVFEWIAIIPSVIGSYLLCSPGNSSEINIGDILALTSALFFAMHIVAVGFFAERHNVLFLSCIQFLTVAVLSCGTALICGESCTFANMKAALIPLLYCGAVSCGIAYTLQIAAQKHLSPSTASIIMSLESVFAVLGGWLFLNESLSLTEGIGCIIIFAAVILAQIPQKSCSGA